MLLPLVRTATVVFAILFASASSYAQTLALPQSLVGHQPMKAKAMQYSISTRGSPLSGASRHLLRKRKSEKRKTPALPPGFCFEGRKTRE